MAKEETLQRIKDTEAEVRRAKGEALDEKEHTLRDARKEAFELRESLRSDAEKRQEAVFNAGDAATAREKQAILVQGQKEADALRHEAQANVDRAVDRLVEKFKGALNA
jgi:V/A-type H+/Na+-transporting ATPase subunit G/H